MKQVIAIAITSLLAGLGQAAQASVVQYAYSASVTSVAGPQETPPVGATAVHVGDTLSGHFSFDDALVGEPMPPWSMSPFPYELAYRGTVQANHVTASLNGVSLVGTPAADASSCSFFDPFCSALPIVMQRFTGATMLGVSTDVLRLHYSVPVPVGGLWSSSGPARVSSIDMDFFYPGELPSAALPSAIRLEDLRFAQMTLNLSSGEGVFARVESISAVPEADACTLFVIGLGSVAAARAWRRRRG